MDTGSAPDRIRGELYPFDAQCALCFNGGGVRYIHSCEHRPVDGRFHAGKDEHIHATKYNDTLPPPELPGHVPPGHVENEFTANGECRRSMGTVPGTARQAGQDAAFPKRLVRSRTPQYGL